jgi:RimJ/RimL family protein N-acetyltransferase
MSSENIILSDEKIQIRTATFDQIEYLRCWKNSQKEYFFHNELINTEQQTQWFQNYKLRDEDYMFIVSIDNINIGCMGIRLIDDFWDIYNVILGNDNYSKLGYMTRAFKLMISFAKSKQQKDITLKVLKINPAVNWYKKNGLIITDEFDNYFLMKLN